MRIRRSRSIGPAAALLLASSLVASQATAQSRPQPALDCAVFVDTIDRRACDRANGGDATAQVQTGLRYLTGHGVVVNSAEAIRLFRLAAAVGDPNGEVYLGYLYETGQGVAKDVPEAIRLFRLAAGQGSARGMNALAWRLAATGRSLDEAQRWAEQAVAREPDNGTYHDTLASVLLRRGQPKPALTEQKRAVTLQPNCASCEDRLGDILAALGRRDEARPHWQRALDLSAGASADPEWDAAAVRRKLGGPATSTR
jgi:tetratricopeptide (TPR) repeat protein